MSCDCEKNNNKFSIGLFLGVITGALVGSYITKNYSKKDFDRLRLKVEDFIKNLGKETNEKPQEIKKVIKKEVNIPRRLIAESKPVVKKSTRTFKKTKKTVA